MTNYITKTIKNGVEANIPVTSVNGQYGDVVVAGKEYNAGKGIEIDGTEISAKAGTGIAVGDGSLDYSAMRGPCNVGYHIGTKDERTNIINAGVSLGAWVVSTGGLAGATYLKMPTGWRTYNTGNVTGISDNTGKYWTSTRRDSNNSWRICFYGSSGSSIQTGFEATGHGYYIRPFKDNPISPDNTRTVLYQGTGSAGIYHNSTLGLISISSDGTTWYTIADKNLGATQVFNWGDTQTSDNSGNFYQRGNNYGFPFSGSVTTSSTQVDASTYGPGNYYSSSTFTTAFNWDSSLNYNLWGGVTGAVISPDGITNTGVLSVNGQTGNITNVVINDSTGSKSIVKVRGGTQAQYEALTTKDPNTLYFTTES